MIILHDSQIKKIFHNGDEVKKILDWDGNVIFYKQSGGGGMTNTIKFHTTSAVTSSQNFTVTYTDSTQDTVSYSEPSKEYSISIPTDKIVTKIDFDNTMVDEVNVSCKVNLSNTFFTNKSKTIRLLSCDSTSSTSFKSIFSGVTNVESIVMRDLNASKVTDTSLMFADCSGATTIDIANWDTSSLTQMEDMFVGCTNVTDLDLSSFNTSAVTSMYGVFDSCEKLVSIKLNGWNTSKVTSLDYMFYGCSSLTSLDLSRFDVSLVTSMSGIFEGCSSLTSLDLSSWNVGIKLKNLGYAFRYCSSLTSLDISGWDISNVTDKAYMFEQCSKLKTIRMVGCNQTTIKRIINQLTNDGILNNVTIVTE